MRLNATLARRLFLIALVLQLRASPAQQTAGVEAMNFKLELENYPPPHENQPKTVLESARVQPQPGGKILLTDAQIKSFNTNGTLELLASTPRCDFDSNRRIASSAEHLQLRTGDGRFFTEGDGFLWHQDESSLLLSNRVHTIMQKDLVALQNYTAQATAPRNNTPADNIEVFSDTFLYNRNSGYANYDDNVRVLGTGLSLTANHLSLELPEPGAPLKRIVADGNVVIDHNDLHATGDRAAYLTADDTVTLTGHPTWRMGRREGHADTLVLDRTNSVFRAIRNASIRFPRESSENGLLLQRPLASVPDIATNDLIEVVSDSYELRTNLAVFRNHVQGTECVENKIQGRLNCELMTIWFAASNQVRQIVAQQQVVVEQNGSRITSEAASFYPTSSIALFTGKPAWQSGPRNGSGDLLKVDNARNELSVIGDARMKLPASQVRIVEMSPVAALTNAAPAPNDSRMVDLSCDAYHLKQDLSTFQGNVRVRNPRGRLDCDLLSVAFAQRPGEESKRAVAERRQNRVELVWIDNHGQTNFSSSDKAVYTYAVTNSVTNELVTLSGDPVITNPQGKHTGDPIVWDRVHNTVSAANERSQIIQTPTNAPNPLPAAPPTNQPTPVTQRQLNRQRL